MKKSVLTTLRPRASKGLVHVRFVVLAVALLGMAVTAGMGRWQLSRAAQKEALQSAMKRQSALPAVDGETLRTATQRSALFYRTVELHGRWMAAHTVYVDNRQMNDKVGFFVMTPLRLEGAGSDAVVLVQRGWVGRNFSNRTQLPAVQTPMGVVTVHARIAPPPSKLMALGKESLFDGAKESQQSVARIQQNMDLGALALRTRLPLWQDISVLQLDAASEGMLRDWPAPSLGVQTHYGYAFQWFSMCALIFILYVWFQLIRPRNMLKTFNNTP